MADMLESLKSLLGDDAENKISSVVNMLSSEKTDSDVLLQPARTGGADTADLMRQAQSLLSSLSLGNDSRSNLLMSLRPYMREDRKKTIDSAVKLLNMARLSVLFKGEI